MIHKLSFEANTDPVKELTKEFGTQLKEVDALQKEISDLSALQSKASKEDVRAQKEINTQLRDRKRQLDAVTGSIAKQVDGSERLTKSVNKLAVNTNSVGIAFANIVRDAPFGIIGIGNNITQTFDAASTAFKQFREQGLSAGQAFARIGSSLLSLNTFLSVGVTLITLFSTGVLGAGKEAEETKDKVIDLTKALDDYINAVKRANDINRLPGTFQFGTSDAQLQRELELLKARGASADEIAAKEKEISASNQTQLELIKQQLQQARNRVSARAEGQDISGLARLPEAIQLLVDDNDLSAINRRLAEVNNEILNEENKRRAIEATNSRERLDELKKEAEALERIRDKIFEIARALNSIDYSDFEAGAKELTRDLDAAKQIADILEKRYPGVGTPGFLQQGPARTDLKTPEELAAEKKIRQDDEKRLKDAEERNKESIKNSLDYALNTTVQTLQSIYDMQIYYLDLEIAARQTRVDQAIELAEKGNTEILESERERLIEAQNERERIGQKQLQLNALLQASSAAIAATQAIQTVTNAGATGDPYTAAARIAAAVAALAAGFAFVTNLTQAFKSGFKDGVIGLEGPGTTTSDSIPAMLSRGESVMTAKETAAYRPYLEAMRNGNFDRMIKTHEPISATGGNSYRTLEKKLDGVIDAIEGNKVIARQTMDKHGIIQVIETVKRHELAKWL